MKANLVKREDRWDLYNKNGHKIASTLKGCSNQLSIKNCEEIELELKKQKKYSEEDMLKAYEKGASFGTTKLGNTHYFDELIQSLQQTECDVWIVMSSNSDYVAIHDDNGCLILKRI
jgi:hypothetical protein